jgi:hypothetical protein
MPDLNQLITSQLDFELLVSAGEILTALDDITAHSILALKFSIIFASTKNTKSLLRVLKRLSVGNKAI